jgi:transposase
MTVKRALEEKRYYKCKACHKPFISREHQRARKQYAKEHLEWTREQWRDMVFTDECSIHTGLRATSFVVRCKGERYHPDCCAFTFRSGRVSTTVWGAIAYGWKSELVFLKSTGKKGGVTKVDYFEQAFESQIVPAFDGLRELGRNPMLMEDNAGIHGTQDKENMTRYKQSRGVPTSWWPACSPDLNPIENVWRIMKQRLRQLKRSPQTFEALKPALTKIWDEMDPDEWGKYIDEMPDRIRECYRVNGLCTKY